MSLSERERLERMPLKYDVVVKRGREVVHRTVAIGELAQVQVDAHHLGLALSAATSVEYSRQQQSTPAPPPGAPKWWSARIGQLIGAGVTYNLPIRTAAPEPVAALEFEP